MIPESASVEAQALEWTIRVQHPDFADWDALSDWLAADPRHAETFDRLTLLDDEVATAVGELEPQPQPQPQHRPPLFAGARRPAPRWALLAAGLAIVLVPAALWLARAALRPGAASSTIAVTTRAGERRELRLADGTRVEIAGATRLSIDPADRRAQLDEGQATFSVAHDGGRRFVVRLGDATVTDVGTVFDLRRRAGRNVVAVAQGEVRVEGVGDPVELTAGRRLRFGAGVRDLDTISPGSVGGWREGRFSYADATVAEVAADIEQATGARIRLSPRVAGRRFAGVIVVGDDAARTLRDAAPVMGLSASRTGEDWVLDLPRDASQPRR